MEPEEYNAELDYYDENMLADFEAYASILESTWEAFDGNEGQNAIVEKYILEAVQSHIANAKERWPYGATPDDYVNDIYSCFDDDVIDRAFSDTIDDTYDQISDYYEDACDLEEDHDDLIDENGGSTYGPHSTASSWT